MSNWREYVYFYQKNSMKLSESAMKDFFRVILSKKTEVSVQVQQ